MYIFKLILNFLRFMVVKNPFKMLALVLGIISLSLIDWSKGSVESKKFYLSGKVDNHWVYVVKDGERKYTTVSFDVKPRTKNNRFYYWEDSTVNILLTVSFGICFLFVGVLTLIGWISDDDDISWEISEVWEDVLSSLIYCELEDGVYYYMIRGRLIDKKSYRIEENLSYVLKIKKISDIYKLPKFSTKANKRNNILKKIGIN